MIDVEVLIAPLISSSKSTVSRTAVAAAPAPLKINADANAYCPPAGGASITTVGA